jgi:hypothetical protein
MMIAMVSTPYVVLVHWLQQNYGTGLPDFSCYNIPKLEKYTE